MENPETEPVVEEPVKEMTAEEKEVVELKEKAMKCKIIALESLGHHPLSNPTEMNKRDKKKVLDVMTMWFHKRTDEEITEEFNDIVCNKILSETDDFTKLKIENNRVGQPELPPDLQVCWDTAGNRVDVAEKNNEIRKKNDEIFSL